MFNLTETMNAITDLAKQEKLDIYATSIGSYYEIKLVRNGELEAFFIMSKTIIMLCFASGYIEQAKGYYSKLVHATNLLPDATCDEVPHKVINEIFGLNQLLTDNGQ